MPLVHVPGIAGVDEAGRGPLAGPVVAAAVILPDGFDLTGLNDSKKLSADQRDRLEERIRAEAVWCIAEASPEEIDRLNILKATLTAMRRALEGLSVEPSAALIDGNQVPLGARCPCSAVVKGDGTYAAIAAASILAKTHRDRLMVALGAEYPEYGFEQHFGYPTPAHLLLLRALGPSPIHRRSFAPVAEAEQRDLFAATG